MNTDWRREPTPAGYMVTGVGRDRTGQHALSAMAGPEFTGVGAVYAPLRVLPLGAQLLALAVLISIGMAGCSIAWVDQQDYQPSINVCRSANAGVPAEQPGSCVPHDKASGANR
ncbi:hypothetical protein [Nocardia sp. NBC_01009]|uniref:hypothetical protein n=1 Tax=Nocardia sp. NBC_01009 TaxID=2975996 RepID=UPI00386E2134|nr:hypothetical protein OHA42_14475 [Nocardia sp. NBC_01009]